MVYVVGRLAGPQRLSRSGISDIAYDQYATSKLSSGENV